MSERRNERKIQAALAIAALEPCLMCGGTADGVGCFAPYDSEEYGAEAGKQRLIFYALCSTCVVTTTAGKREQRFDGHRRAP